MLDNNLDLVYYLSLDIPVILTPHSGDIDPPDNLVILSA
jgi:hypothetical protein